MIYTIMASYLGEFKGCAKNRIEKFIRAVDSFLSNTYSDKKIIVISDGCEETVKICSTRYCDVREVICLTIPKQVLFSGEVRNEGIRFVKKESAVQDIVCYLDSDDSFGKNHLKIIADNFGSADLVMYDTYRSRADGKFYHSAVSMEACHIGTSSFAHKACLDVVWPDGYGHDWKLLSELSNKYTYTKIPMPEYYIHHTPGSDC